MGLKRFGLHRREAQVYAFDHAAISVFKREKWIDEVEAIQVLDQAWRTREDAEAEYVDQQ